MTSFDFDASYDAFLVGDAGGWAWSGPTGEHFGVLKRVVEATSGTISTTCHFDNSTVKIRFDIAPIVASLSSSFTLSIGALMYMTVTLPGTTSASVTSPITVLGGASLGSVDEIAVGTVLNDVAWTHGVEITIPSVQTLTSTTLELTHTGGGSGSTDVAIDNLLVIGGTCGTGSACTCGRNAQYAAGGASTGNNDGRMYLVETKDSIAPGYADNAELTCAHCGKQDESSWVGKNRTFIQL